MKLENLSAFVLLLASVNDTGLERRNPKSIIVRDAYHGKHWTALTEPEEVREVIELLIEKDCLLATPIKTGGRSTVKYWLHPKIFDESGRPKGS